MWLNRNRVPGSYEVTNKRTEILLLASTSHIAIAYLCNHFNHVFALLISIHISKALILINVSLKLSNFCKKIKFFECWGLAPTPQWPPADGQSFQTPKTTLAPLQISGYSSDTRRVLLILPSFRISR